MHSATYGLPEILKPWRPHCGPSASASMKCSSESIRPLLNRRGHCGCRSCRRRSGRPDRHGHRGNVGVVVIVVVVGLVVQVVVFVLALAFGTVMWNS